MQTKAEVLTWQGVTGPFGYKLTPGVFKPTTTSKLLAEGLQQVMSRLSLPTVIDMGCGCGVLSFVAARLHANEVFGSDLSKEAVELATENAASLGLEAQTEFRDGSLFEPLRDVRADVVIGDVAGIPNAIAEFTGWFPGGESGAELPIQMIESVGDRLKPGGAFLLPTGTIQDQEAVLSAAKKVFQSEPKLLLSKDQLVLKVPKSHVERVKKLRQDGLITCKKRSDRVYSWEVSIWRCVKV